MTGNGLSDELRRVGQPFVEQQLAHPTVVALGEGTLDVALAREWLGQDYLYLIKERRFLARLAWQAPEEHFEELVTKLVDVATSDLAAQRELCALFDTDLSRAALKTAGLAYTEWLYDSAAVYGEGLIALWAGLWGYSTLGSMMSVPANEPYATWVRSYQSADFVALARRYESMVNQLDIGIDRAVEVFNEGMHHEIAFWDPM